MSSKLKEIRDLSGQQLNSRIKKAQSQVKLYALENQLERASSGYTGASTTKRWSRNWDVVSGTPDEVGLESREDLADRVSDLYRNSSVPRGAINTVVENSIGTGLKLKLTLDRDFLNLTDEEAELIESDVERKFFDWASSKECDATRRQNFFEMQESGFKNSKIEGEIFALLPRFKRKGSKVKLKIQLLPSRRCQNPFVANSDTIRDGIEFTVRGEPKTYYFSKTEGYFTGSHLTNLTPVPAFGTKTGRPNVLHIFRPDYVGQSRGIPFLSSVIEDIKQMDRYTKSELANAAVQALLTGFIKSNNPDALGDPLSGTAEAATNTREQDYVLDAGAMYHLQPGEEIDFIDPKRPASGFSAFMEQYLTIIGMATSIPYESLVKRFNSSFSASKASRIEAWRHYSIERRRFEQSFCTPVFKEFMLEMVLTGQINLAGFIEDDEVRNAYCSHEWLGDAQGQIDPVKETNAAILKINNGLSNRQKESAAMGNDFEKNVPMLKREAKLMVGTQFKVEQPGPLKKPSNNPFENEEEDEDEENEEEAKDDSKN